MKNFRYIARKRAIFGGEHAIGRRTILFLLLVKGNQTMYIKKWTSAQIVKQSAVSTSWVKWVHHTEGESHCEECLMLDGCYFVTSQAPLCPHHPNCHCTLEPVDHEEILRRITAYSDYGKFDPYLFNTQGRHPHGKDKLFKTWGYTVEDAHWLQSEIERQAQEKYILGHYLLGRLNKDGQRISIRVELPRKNSEVMVSFLTGWRVYPDGKIKLTTPYGGQ